MIRNKFGWVKVSSGDKYFGYAQGTYYKVNHALLYFPSEKRLILRNTYSGDERVIARNISKSKAIKLMRDYMREHPVY